MAAEAVAQLTSADPGQTVFLDGDFPTVVLVHEPGTASSPTKLQLLALRDPGSTV